MFHPERLTGARARAYQRSLNWVESLPIREIPATIRSSIKSCANVKGIVQVKTTAGKSHRVAIIRNRVALLDHPHEEVTQTLAFLGNHDQWEACRCRNTREIYATLTQTTSHDAPKIRGRRPEYAEQVNHVHDTILDLRMRCRAPKRDYRVVSIRGSRRRFSATSSARAKEKPTKYNEDLRSRWYGLIPKLEGLFRAHYLVGERRFVDRVTSNIQANAIEIAPKKTLSIRLDLYSWFSRIFSQDIRPCGSLVPLSICPMLGRQLIVYLDLKLLPGPANDDGYKSLYTADYVRVETYGFNDVLKPKNPYRVNREEWDSLKEWESRHRVVIEKPKDKKENNDD